MDFARQQRDPTRHIIGIVFVVLVHALVIYALVTGLARKAVEVIKKPINATIIEEIKAPPPPPEPWAMARLEPSAKNAANAIVVIFIFVSSRMTRRSNSSANPLFL